MILAVLSLLLLDIFYKPQSPAPSVSPSPQPKTYSQDDLEKDFQRIVSRQPLSSADLSIRQKLIKSLGEKSGILAKTDSFQIEYVKSADSFMIEILSTDTNAAKNTAADWLLQQDLSKEGICNLPVVFYLSSTVKQQLEETNQRFNPIPEGCK